VIGISLSVSNLYHPNCPKLTPTPGLGSGDGTSPAAMYSMWVVSVARFRVGTKQDEFMEQEQLSWSCPIRPVVPQYVKSRLDIKLESSSTLLLAVLFLSTMVNPEMDTSHMSHHGWGHLDHKYGLFCFCFGFPRREFSHTLKVSKFMCGCHINYVEGDNHATSKHKQVFENI